MKKENITQENKNEHYLPMKEFTHREKRIAVYLLYGKTRAQIAEALAISENTVKTHTQHIYEKTEVNSQKEFMIKYLIDSNI